FDRTHAEGLDAVRCSGAQVVSFTAAGPAEATPADPATAADRAREEALRELTRADLVLDGILGTGGRRGLPGHLAGLIADWAPRRSASQLAAHVPSDLRPDADGAKQRKIGRASCREKG